MILRFHSKETGERLNVFFDRGTYNYNFDPEAHYIEVDRDALLAIAGEVNFNCYEYSEPLVSQDQKGGTS